MPANMPAAPVIDPPQPAGQGEYPLTALIPSTIQVFANQAEYQSKTGKPVPAYNPGLPVKLWLDTAIPAGAGFGMVSYNTIHLDPSFQKPVVTQITIPSFLAGSVNIPPDTGPWPSSTAGQYLTPMRALLPNEKLIPKQMGLIDVANLDIYDPFPPPPGTGGSGGGFTEADRATLNAIAGAMGLNQTV